MSKNKFMSFFSDLDSFKKNGIIKIKNFLSQTEVDKIIKGINPFIGSKGEETTYFSNNYKKNLFKLFKFQFSKFLISNYLIKISKEKKMNQFADLAFGKRSYLSMIDSYNSPINDKEVLPWHVDQAYSGKNKINENEIVHHDQFSIKFFIYLTKVGSNNGCTSYIPGTHKITYALRKGIKEKKIKYSSYWLLKDLRNIVTKKENFEYFNNYFNNSNVIKKFLIDTDFINTNPDSKKFDFEMLPGDIIIFDEGGVHRGSKILYNDRQVLRYHYSIINLC
jgi:hypothetical protein